VQATIFKELAASIQYLSESVALDCDNFLIAAVVVED